jgi:ABC-type molybdate transport system ATPase subunit
MDVLSGGEKQRMAVSRALSVQPQVYVMHLLSSLYMTVKLLIATVSLHLHVFVIDFWGIHP